MFSQVAFATLSAFATLASTTVLKPIADPVHLFPHLLKAREATDYGAFNPSSTHSFFWADEPGPSSTFVANFTLLAPGEHEDIIALKDIVQNLKKISCDDTANTITINLFSEDCYKVAQNVWDWVNKNSDNTFILVTEAGQCDPDEVRDPYLVSGAKFDKNDWTVTFDAKRQVWSDVAHSFRLRTSRVSPSEPQQSDSPATGGDDFYDSEINELFAKAEELQADLTLANQSSPLDAATMAATRQTFSEAINATVTKGFSVLDKLSSHYGSAVAEIVSSTKKEYQDLQALIDSKEAELIKNCDTNNQTEWALHQEALELHLSAAEVMESAFSAIYATLGQPTPQSLSARSPAPHLSKRLSFWEKLWNGIKQAAETVVNGVANLLGANKPLTIDLASSWTPEIYSIGHQTDDFGVDLSIGADLKTGGKLIAEFEVDVDFDAASKIQAHVNPEGVFGSIALNVSAGGYLTKPLKWEPLHYDVPIPYATFEIPFLVKIGPFVSLGLPLSVQSLEGQAMFGIGAKATISDDAVVLIDMVNGTNSVVSGWTPKFEMVGPDFSAELSGHVAAWLSIQLKLEASILDGKLGAYAALDAQAPRFDARFNASTSFGDLENGGVCNSDSPHGIGFEADVGVNLNLNAGLLGGSSPPSVQYDLLKLNWPLYETCLAIGAPAAPKTLAPTATVAARSAMVTPAATLVTATVAR